MSDEACQQYLEDPEAHAAHLVSCADCRRMEEELASLDRTLEVGKISEVGGSKISADALPVAGWEGAAHRPWPLVLATGSLLLIVVIAAFAVVGISPVTGLMTAAQGEVSDGAVLFQGAQRFGRLILEAPMAFHLGVAIAFVVVNGVLFLLLRRAPRGIDG